MRRCECALKCGCNGVAWLFISDKILTERETSLSVNIFRSGIQIQKRDLNNAALLREVQHASEQCYLRIFDMRRNAGRFAKCPSMTLRKHTGRNHALYNRAYLFCNAISPRMTLRYCATAEMRFADTSIAPQGARNIPCSSHMEKIWPVPHYTRSDCGLLALSIDGECTCRLKQGGAIDNSRCISVPRGILVYDYGD